MPVEQTKNQYDVFNVTKISSPLSIGATVLALARYNEMLPSEIEQYMPIVTRDKLPFSLLCDEHIFNQQVCTTAKRISENNPGLENALTYGVGTYLAVHLIAFASFQVMKSKMQRGK